MLTVGVGHAGVHLCHQSACPLREHECPLSTPPSGKDHNSYGFSYANFQQTTPVQKNAPYETLLNCWGPLFRNPLVSNLTPS